MKLLLKRIFKGNTYTIGKLHIDGEYFCDTIEDRVRELPVVCPNTPRGIACTCKHKVYAETAIPDGTYKVTMQYSPRFKRVLPYLHDVPHFIGILIHIGSNQSHTSGCLIVGKNTLKGRVTDSRAVSERLNAEIDIAIKRGESVELSIQ